MSHSYPYRRLPPPADESRPNLGTYSSSDHHHASGGYNFYREPQEASSHLPPSSSSSSSSSYPLSSSSRASVEPSYSGQRLDSAVSILSSCGLQPNDLSLLAELPEDVLTLESLPHLLKEIKGKRETPTPYPPIPSSSSSSSSSSSHPPGSSRLPAASPPSSEWDRLRSQPVQYPLNHTFMTPKPLPPEQVQDWQDRWGNPRKTSSTTYKRHSSPDPPPPPPPPPSSTSPSSSYVVDYAHKGRSTDYGKKGRDGGLVSRYDRPSYSSAAGGDGNRKAPPRISQPRSADYRFMPPPEEQRPKDRADRRESDASYNKKSGSGGSRLSTALTMPSRKAALDFHGTLPTTYPYACSLCDITVLSEKFWIKHINAPQHADGQLTLLQLFPDWDCRLETISTTDDQPEKPKEEGRPAQQPWTTSQSSYPQPNKNTQKKHSGNGKVVSVKFPAQSVDEKYLRTLTEPFGRIVKVITFPSLAFVELGSSDQAKDLVKYYSSNPASVNGEELSFYISSTFNFLQSSQVLSFTPAPDGEDGPSDLISITKRFGSPLYTLFLPSMAFIEMKNAADAQKLVDYYSSNTLRINGEIIKVSFSGEYNSLMRVSSAKKYEEESSSTKRSRSPSPRRSDEPAPSKRSRSSREMEEEEEERERRTRSRSSDRSSDRSSRDDRSKERAAVPDKTQHIETESKAVKPASPKPETSQNAPMEVEAASSGEESDIEGMEVIGEDGENLEDDDMKSPGSTNEEEEEEEEEEEVEEGHEAVLEEDAAEEDAAEQEKEKVKREEPGNQEKLVKKKEEEEGHRREEVPEEVISWIKMENKEPETKREPEETTVTQPEDEEEPDFPEDLENCITLDELDEDESDDQDGTDREKPKPPSTRVIYFKNLPQRFYSDADFVKIGKDFGKVARYLLIRHRREGFIEMSSSSEALRALRELSCKSLEFHGYKLDVQISHKYRRLTVGWRVQSDPESDEERRRDRRSRSSRRERSSKSRTSKKEESGKRSSEREVSNKTSPKKTPEEELAAERTPRKEELATTKTPEKELTAKKTADEETKVKGVCLEEEEAKPGSKDPEIREKPSATDPPGPDAEKRAGDALKDAAEVEQQPGPAGGAVGPDTPTTPVGVEFVQPVVGYFCNLCQVIYSSEEEAKKQHCSSPAHYRRYQEHTGKNPWTS